MKKTSEPLPEAPGELLISCRHLTLIIVVNFVNNPSVSVRTGYFHLTSVMLIMSLNYDSVCCMKNSICPLYNAKHDPCLMILWTSVYLSHQSSYPNEYTQLACLVLEHTRN